MAKPGLVALADAYGIERTQQKEFKLLGERLFEQLRDELAPLLAHSMKLVGLGQAMESFAEFCADDPAQHTLLFGHEDEPVFAFRIQGALARAFLDVLLGNLTVPNGDPASAPAPMTFTEARMLSQILIGVLLKAASRILDPLLRTSATLKVLGTRDGAGVIAETFAPPEPFLTAIGRYMLHGREGTMALGLPVARALQMIAQATAASRHDDAQADQRKARELLGDAALRLEAVLGAVTLPLSVINELAPGAVIPLGRLHGSAPSIELRAAGQVLFSGTVVADRGWYRVLLQQGEKSSGQSGSC